MLGPVLTASESRMPLWFLSVATAEEQGGVMLGALTYSVYEVGEGYPGDCYPEAGPKGCVGGTARESGKNIPNGSTSCRSHRSLCLDRADECLP